jgi:hypothetical protein
LEPQKLAVYLDDVSVFQNRRRAAPRLDVTVDPAAVDSEALKLEYLEFRNIVHNDVLFGNPPLFCSEIHMGGWSSSDNDRLLEIPIKVYGKDLQNKR